MPPTETFKLFDPGDGCSLWFNTWRGIDVSPCCDAHDWAYAFGRTVGDWLTANANLLVCGVAMGAWDWALLAFVGVSSPLAVLLFFLGKKEIRPPKDTP